MSVQAGCGRRRTARRCPGRCRRSPRGARRRAAARGRRPRAAGTWSGRRSRRRPRRRWRPGRCRPSRRSGRRPWGRPPPRRVASTARSRRAAAAARGTRRRRCCGRRAVGRADQVVVGEVAAVGVELLARLEGDRVQPALGSVSWTRSPAAKGPRRPAAPCGPAGPRARAVGLVGVGHGGQVRSCGAPVNTRVGGPTLRSTSAVGARRSRYRRPRRRRYSAAGVRRRGIGVLARERPAG